jgi:hypothetical protein
MGGSLHVNNAVDLTAPFGIRQGESNQDEFLEQLDDSV